MMETGERKTLLVKEQKLKNYAKWNLPGGHLEAGEGFQEGAIREALEETCLSVRLISLVGIYENCDPLEHCIRVVFVAEILSGEATAADEILEVKWFSQSEIESIPAGDYVGNTRQVLSDYHSGVAFPLAVLKVESRQTWNLPGSNE